MSHKNANTLPNTRSRHCFVLFRFVFFFSLSCIRPISLRQFVLFRFNLFCFDFCLYPFPLRQASFVASVSRISSAVIVKLQSIHAPPMTNIPPPHPPLPLPLPPPLPRREGDAMAEDAWQMQRRPSAFDAKNVSRDTLEVSPMLQ